MFDHLSYSELEQLWGTIHTKLKTPFPAGTLKFKKNKYAYIPIKAYIHRLNEVAGPVWQWKITKEKVNEEQGLIEVNGVLKILHREAEGQGFHEFFKGSNQYAYKDALRSAASDALRNACDLFEIGWVDLAPYRDWGQDKGIGIETIPKPENIRICVKCKKPLTEEDEELLRKLKISNVQWCSEDIPEHIARKLNNV